MEIEPERKVIRQLPARVTHKMDRFCIKRATAEGAAGWP
jgi:hypothetical protein